MGEFRKTYTCLGLEKCSEKIWEDPKVLWLLYVAAPLHSWDNSHLLLYNPFYVSEFCWSVFCWRSFLMISRFFAVSWAESLYLCNLQFIELIGILDTYLFSNLGKFQPLFKESFCSFSPSPSGTLMCIFVWLIVSHSTLGSVYFSVFFFSCFSDEII